MARQSLLNNSKLLLGGIVLLILVLIGEGVYVLYTRDGLSLCPSAKTEEESAVVPGETQCFTLERDYRAPLNVNFLEYLKRFDEATLRSSRVVNQYSGSVVEIDNEPGVVGYEHYTNVQKQTYPYELKIVIENDGVRRTFYLTEALLKNTTVLRVNGESVANLGIDDLAVGDEVDIHQTYDLMRGACIEHECVSAIQIVRR